MHILVNIQRFLLCLNKVPGRMGMIVTLYLISANVYNAVEAPSDRGFSYIEMWMVGTQIPILLALCEYGFVLYLKKVENKLSKNQANKKRKICSTMMKLKSLRCCRKRTRPSTAPSMNLDQPNNPLSELGRSQMLNLDEPQPDLDERIKKLDFATMIFSFIYFITFVSLYFTVL